MRAFQAIIIGGPGQPQLQHGLALPLEVAELAQQHFRVAGFEVVPGLLHFVLMIDVAVGHILVPAQIIDRFHALQVHGQAFQAVGQLHADW